MKIKATRAFGVAGTIVSAGDTVEVNEALARELVHRGRAIHIAADQPQDEPVAQGEPEKKPKK